jgi:hypothetical protein
MSVLMVFTETMFCVRWDEISQGTKMIYHVIKSGYQGKQVVNKVTAYWFWFDYGMIPWRDNM